VDAIEAGRLMSESQELVQLMHGPDEKVSESSSELEAAIIAVLHTCFDPEIPVDIYELGLIYEVDVQPEGGVCIKMTLTSPGCPVAGSLPLEVEQKVGQVPGVTTVKVELVWDPPWCMDKMSEAAKLQLGMF
jgi:FeS assembly SUF system protein